MVVTPGQPSGGEREDYFNLDQYEKLLGRLEKSRADVKEAKAARRASTSKEERKERGETVREMKAKRRRIKNRLGSMNRD